MQQAKEDRINKERKEGETEGKKEKREKMTK